MTPPVCITGMHRSGTSLVARLLNLCGLHLGAESDLVTASPFNPEGYWEHRDLVLVNDEVLACLKGGWDVPPVADAGWEDRAELAPQRARAARTLAELRRADWWGWKDPRIALTLPFWRRLAPEARVVVCVRHPLEVALSLHRRGYSSVTFGLQLWLAYTRSLLQITTPAERLVTHFDAYLADAPAELARLLTALERPAEAAQIGRACAAVKPELRHHVRAQPNAAPAVPAEVMHLYQTLCREAGPAGERAWAAAPQIAAASANPAAVPLHEWEIASEELRREAETLSRELARATAALAAMERSRGWRVVRGYRALVRRLRGAGR
jgi:hypothetical protein